MAGKNLETVTNILLEFHGNRCPIVANNERMKNANAAVTLLGKNDLKNTLRF